MAAKFVRIPFGTRIRFPGFCPFTGQAGPRGRVQIIGRKTELFLPIPFIGLFRVGKVGRLTFPANVIIAWGEKLLWLLSWLAFVGGIAICIILGKKADAQQIYDGRDIDFLLGGFLAFFALKIIRSLCLSRVRMVRVGTTSLELRFASERYAKEFARLNELHASDHRTKKRMVPFSVNAAR